MFTKICKLEKVIIKKKPNGDIYSICFASDPEGVFKFIYSDHTHTISNHINKSVFISGTYMKKFMIIKSACLMEDFFTNTKNLHIKITNQEEILSLKNILKNHIVKIDDENHNP